MGKTTDAETRKVAARSRQHEIAHATPGSQRQAELLVEAIDHCLAAKGIADDIDDGFLAYLLAMAIQEARAAIRRSMRACEIVDPDAAEH